MSDVVTAAELIKEDFGHWSVEDEKDYRARARVQLEERLSSEEWAERKSAMAMDVDPGQLREFLLRLATTGNASLACKDTGLSYKLMHWRKRVDPEFAEDYELSRRVASDILEHEAYRRGVVGIDKPIVAGGEVVGSIREYSDRLLELLIKRNDERDRKRQAVLDINLGSGEQSIRFRWQDGSSLGDD